MIIEEQLLIQDNTQVLHVASPSYITENNLEVYQYHFEDSEQ
jgi:hypothetical protein